MFGLENLFDEKDMYPFLHREMFGRHLWDIYPSWVFTSTEHSWRGDKIALISRALSIPII